MRCRRYADAADVASSHRCSKQAESNFLPPGVFLEQRMSGEACWIWFFSAVLRTTLIADVAAAREDTCLAPALLGVAFFAFFAFFFLFLEATLLLTWWRDASLGMAPKRNTRNQGRGGTIVCSQGCGNHCSQTRTRMQSLQHRNNREELFVATAEGIIAPPCGRRCRACEIERGAHSETQRFSFLVHTQTLRFLDPPSHLGSRPTAREKK